MFFDPSIVVQPDFRQYLAPVAARMSCNEYSSNPSINIQIDDRPVRYNTDKSSAQLKGFSIDTISPYGANVHTRISGLTEGKIDFSMQASVEWVSHPVLHTSCLWFKTITVKIRTIPTVYIASEHLHNKCRYRTTLDHEMKHVEVDRRIAREYAPELKRAVMRQVRDIGVVWPGPTSQIDGIRADMLESINQAVANVVAEMNTQRRDRQQGIDTKREYDRLSKMCGGKF